jgi:hypothetical protein
MTQHACSTDATQRSRQDRHGMQIAERPPTPLVLPGGKTVRIPTRRWVLERWEGEPDPADLRPTWARKPRFSVSGRCLRAEFAILDHLQGDGWHGVWVNAYSNELRPEWFPPRLSRRLPRLARRPGHPGSSATCGPPMTGSSVASSMCLPGGNRARSDSSASLVERATPDNLHIGSYPASRALRGISAHPCDRRS